VGNDSRKKMTGLEKKVRVIHHHFNEIVQREMLEWMYKKARNII